MSLIPHNKPSLNEEESTAIKETIAKGWISQGEKVKKFEDKICEYVGFPSNHGVAVSSGTSALYLSLKILGVGYDDEVIFPTYVCSALLNAVDMLRAKSILMDVEENDFNISLQKVKEKVTPKTKAIIIPHMFGVPADVLSIKELKIPIIEDCAVALGSKINGKHVGTFGDLTIYSFYSTKVITTGQGGMLLSKNVDYINQARDFINYDGRREYIPRFNFQMTDIQATMGLVQLSKLNRLLERRKMIADSYKDICIDKGWNFQRPENENFDPNWYRFVIKSDAKTIHTIKTHLEKNDIQATIPIERWELLHNYLHMDPTQFQISEMISQQTLSLPIYPDLVVENNLEKIVDSLANF